MGKVIRLTESELKNMIKKLVLEQSIIGALSDPSNSGLSLDTDAGGGKCLEKDADKRSVTELFTLCRKRRVVDTPSVIPLYTKLKNQISGLSSKSGTINVLNEVKTFNDFCVIDRLYSYGGNLRSTKPVSDLWKDLNSEWSLNWNTIGNALSKVLHDGKISRCKSYSKNNSPLN
jgi:hypothetical protein